MITYDSRNWLAALALHRSDTFRKLLPTLLVVAVFTWAIGYIETEYLRLSKADFVSNLPVMHSLLGFAISMLLVFRTNTAYERWWEARKLWGQLVNVSRNTAIKVDAIFPAEDASDRAAYVLLIGRFAKELRRHLLSEQTRTALDEGPPPELERLDRTKHVPAQIASLMHAHARAHRAFRDGRITGDQLIGLANDLAAFMDICGACERIKNTPIPYSYSTFLDVVCARSALKPRSRSDDAQSATPSCLLDTMKSPFMVEKTQLSHEAEVFSMTAGSSKSAPMTCCTSSRPNPRACDSWVSRSAAGTGASSSGESATYTSSAVRPRAIARSRTGDTGTSIGAISWSTKRSEEAHRCNRFTALAALCGTLGRSIGTASARPNTTLSAPSVLAEGALPRAGTQKLEGHPCQAPLRRVRGAPRRAHDPGRVSRRAPR